MPYKIRKVNDKYEVIGPYKDERFHVYGVHKTKESAEKQIKALYSNVYENKVIDDPIPNPPGGMDKDDGKSTHEYPKLFKPSLFKMPMNNNRFHERRIMDFKEFMKRLNYRTHDGQSDETTQRGHGQNLRGK